MDNSPLRKLSPELRNKVYSMTVHDYRERHALDPTKPDVLPIEKAISPAIGRVCHQIRQECLLMCYHDLVVDAELPYKNWLTSFGNVEMVEKWLKIVYPLERCLNSIARLELNFTMHYLDADKVSGEALQDPHDLVLMLRDLGLITAKLDTIVTVWGPAHALPLSTAIPRFRERSGLMEMHIDRDAPGELRHDLSRRFKRMGLPIDRVRYEVRKEDDEEDDDESFEAEPPRQPLLPSDMYVDYECSDTEDEDGDDYDSEEELLAEHWDEEHWSILRW